MNNFLERYRGAKIYESEVVDPTKGRKLRAKVVAKAIIPGQQNLKVDFIERAPEVPEAVARIKKAIDRYLEEHEFDTFATEEPGSRSDL